MVDEKIIIDTIKELLDANLDKETIFSTLEDIGANKEEIEKYYNQVVNKVDEKTENKEEDTKVEENKEEKHTKELLENYEKIDKINEEEIKEKPEIKSFSSENNIKLEKQINEVEEKIIEISAKLNALTKIMKDILEENRNILNKLK